MQMLSRQRGLSLIELMIGILLSSLLLLGVLRIFDSNRDTMRMQLAYSRVQESGRFAMDFLTREIRMADFWGCAPDKGSIQSHLDTSDTPDYKAAVHGEIGGNGVRGRDNVNGVSEGGMPVRPNTDILTLSGAENACGGAGRMVDGASLHVSPTCGGIQPGQVVLISNCKAGELMTITKVQEGGASDKKTLEYEGGRDGRKDKDEGWIKNLAPPLALQEDYGTDSTILRPYSRTFFVADSPVTRTPSLFMSEDGRPAQELVPGIEDMQVRYGRDSSANGVVDTWQDADNISAPQMEEVTVIRVQLLVASDGSVGVSEQNIDGTQYTDGRLRKLYTATAKIRNRGM